MDKALENVIDRLPSWPKEAQEQALKSLVAIEADRVGSYRLSPDEEAAVDEVAQYLMDAWDKGIASGPGKYASIEDIIGEARRRLSDERGQFMPRPSPLCGG
jgi:hypothetical protein